MEDNIDISISNFIFTLIKYSRQCKCDLDFAFNIFLLEEEYEKCSVLKKLIDNKYYDNDKQSNYKRILNVINKINEFDGDNEEMLHSGKELLKLKRELMYFIDKIEELYYVNIPSLQNTEIRLNIVAMEFLKIVAD
jgi:iron-sulfur cluster repair protein YtfE (RIC family)